MCLFYKQIYRRLYIKKINPSINVGEKLTVIDPFGGSGGFTTGYINFINEKYPNFNWENEIDNIYHYDMNEDVVINQQVQKYLV